MNEVIYWSIERTAGLMLLLGIVLALPGLMMFWIRGGMIGGLPPSPIYYAWERILILSAVVPTVIGFVLLSGTLKNPTAIILAKIGATTFLLGGVLVVCAEALSLTLGYEKVIYLLGVYVVLACLSQALIGIALLISGMLAPWVGWTTILVNILGLASLLVFSRQDLYFPILHHFAPILIGIGLLSAKL